MCVQAVVLSLVAMQGAVGAPVCNDPCVRAARLAYRECRRDAATTLVASRVLCRGRDLVCVQACLAAQASCVQATGLIAALTSCLSDGAASAQACVSRFTFQPKKRTHCINQAQLQTYQCRNQARSSRRQELARCAVGFRQCAQPCGPNQPPSGSRLCLAQALQTNNQAVATCNETAAADKSACLAKDTACVQTCRDARTACTTPLQTAIDAVVESCEAGRLAALATCGATTAPGPVRDSCIETANSDAFVCRDSAEEAEAPGLVACTRTYIGCIRACPPA
jgi:hypothetical protein